jgi:ubiquitin C-terminal hydrolase
MNNNQNNDKINPINNSMNNPMNNNNMNAQKNSDMNNQMINNMNAQLNNDKNNQINNSMGNQMNQINNNMSNQMGNNMSNPINNSMSNQMNFNQNNISIDPNNQNSNMNIINNQSMQNNNMNINQNNNNIQMSVPLENGNQHMQNIQNQKYSFSRYKIAARTGLQNLGDTSYLNSVLQLLGCIRNLASYFVKPSNQKYFVDNINNASLSFVFHRIFSHFYPYPEKNQREVYDTSTFLQVLGSENQVYNTKKRRNPNDLIIYCLDKIHKEINFAKNKIEFDTNINIFNKDDVIKKRFNEYLAFNDSIVSKNFTWFEIKQLRCKTCSTQAYNLNSFFIYNLDISGAFQQHNSPLTILKCLEYQYKKTKTNFCQSCNNYQQMDIETKIFSSPLSFVFSIDRGNCDMNLMQIPFTVEQYIDINNYLEIKEAFHKFEIQGIVSIYLGENNKYVCFAKSPVDKQWYLYDDGNVMNVDINAILNVHNNNGGYIPCILLYQFIK